ncbi:MAG: hypothetical protein HKN04_13705 [Rhodothermaceae bacterium]|nr:hypothetical protein [Rhodothermaceae bacterium]
MHCEFRGDRFTRLDLRGHRGVLLTDATGQPLAGTNGNRLIRWTDGTCDVVPIRALRLLNDAARKAVRCRLRAARRLRLSPPIGRAA